MPTPPNLANDPAFEAKFWPKREQSQAMRDVIAERFRQIEKEGWTPEHDDEHGGGELARAAACYAAHASAFQRVRYDVTLKAYQTADAPRYGYGWPWSLKWWKPKNPRRDLVRAAALIVAEIERLDRREAAAP
jgi:hypothetical protein